MEPLRASGFRPQFLALSEDWFRSICEPSTPAEDMWLLDMAIQMWLSAGRVIFEWNQIGALILRTVKVLPWCLNLCTSKRPLARENDGHSIEDDPRIY